MAAHVCALREQHGQLCFCTHELVKIEIEKSSKAAKILRMWYRAFH